MVLTVWIYTIAKSVDVEMIRQEFLPSGERSDIPISLDNTNTEIITRKNGHSVIHRGMGKKKN